MSSNTRISAEFNVFHGRLVGQLMIADKFLLLDAATAFFELRKRKPGIGGFRLIAMTFDLDGLSAFRFILVDAKLLARGNLVAEQDMNRPGIAGGPNS